MLLCFLFLGVLLFSFLILTKNHVHLFWHLNNKTRTKLDHRRRMVLNIGGAGGGGGGVAGARFRILGGGGKIFTVL